MAVEFTFAFPLPRGLHARPASFFQEKAERFEADVFWDNLRNGSTADAKSILSLIGTDTLHNDPCRIRISGRDESAALGILKNLIEDELPGKEIEAEQIIPAAATDVPRILLREQAVVFRAIPAGSGVVRGRVRIHDPGLEGNVEESRAIRPAEEERNAFLGAAASLESEMGKRLGEKKDATERAVINAHLAILRDRAFAAKVIQGITAEKLGAAGAVSRACRIFSSALQASRSSYLRERMADIRDVCRQLIFLLAGTPAEDNAINLTEAAILVADDLPPSLFLSLDSSKIEGLVLENAGVTSHTLIVARAREIPAVTGCPGIRRKLQDGEDVILDGGRGLVVPAPTAAVIRYYERESSAEKTKRARRREQARLPGATADGHKVEIGANIGHPEELSAAWANGADGVGLFRTELLLLDRQAPPDEEEQYALYSRVAQEAGGRPVILRTFDIGGDKPIPFIRHSPERNPFLGVRGVRVYEEHEDLIRVQLRAILRAAARGPLKIMFPMVSTVDEVIRMTDLLRLVREELAREGVPHRPATEIGIMVEVPSAALLVDRFSEHVDFFSVGSNDLLQYFFAADRGNPAVRQLNQPSHPAFLRLLKAAVDTARARGKWIGLCGEIAASARVLPLLIGLGFDELSLTSPGIPEIKARLQTLNSVGCRRLLNTALRCSLSGEVEILLDSFASQSAARALITPEMICLSSDSRSKTDVLQELAIMMEADGRVDSRAEFERALWQREDMFSTGIGFGVAIPHCQTAAVRSPSVAFLRFTQPLDWNAADGKPVAMAVLLAIPAGAEREHLKLLAGLSRRLVHDEFRSGLLSAIDETTVLGLIADALQPKDPHPG